MYTLSQLILCKSVMDVLRPQQLNKEYTHFKVSCHYFEMHVHTQYTYNYVLMYVDVLFNNYDGGLMCAHTEVVHVHKEAM